MVAAIQSCGLATLRLADRIGKPFDDVCWPVGAGSLLRALENGSSALRTGYHANVHSSRIGARRFLPLESMVRLSQALNDFLTNSKHLIPLIDEFRYITHFTFF